MNSYSQCSREELLQEITLLKEACNRMQQEKTIYESARMLKNLIALRQTMSEVLALLLSSNEDRVIDEALLLVLKFFKVDRVYIGVFQSTKRVVDFTHEVTCDGIISMREDLLRNHPEDDIPWWTSMIREGKDIVIYNVAEMPEEASVEQELLLMQEVKSLLTIPVLRDGKVSGFIGLDSVKCQRNWKDLDIENLRLLADILSIAIERSRVQGLMEYSSSQLLKSEAKFQIIFEKLPWGVELYDEYGNLLDLNQADLDIFRTTKENAVGINMFDNPNIPEDINRRLRKGEDVMFMLTYNFNTVHNTGYYTTEWDDEMKYLKVKGVSLKDENNAIFGYLYIVFDDTENYLKSENTRNNLAKLQAAVNTGDAVIWEYDTQKKKMEVNFNLNDSFEQGGILAYLRENCPTNLDEFLSTIHPNDYDLVYKQHLEPLLNGEIDNYIITYRRILNGKLFWMSSNVRSYKFNKDETPSKVVSYTTNITRQRESEVELIKVKEADKLKSAFLANMSHEIRTPLNAIVGFSNIISETQDPKEKESYLEIIHKNNELLLQLIDDILDFSKIESGTLSYRIDTVDIKEICKELVISDSLKLKPNVNLLFDSNLPSIFIKTDSKRIVQVLSNFVNNAIKFTKQGSVTITYKKEKGYLLVSVKDTGIGISEIDKARVFERFVKVDCFKQGTGLGLTICKTIIENLGGTIGVESKENEGSTFWFTLPMNKIDIEQEATTQAPVIDMDTAVVNMLDMHSILIAEDVMENYLLLQALFGKKYKLYHARNGKEAVELFKEMNPDMVLMDIKMPVMNGFEATREIRKLSETVPVIALTAFAYESEKIMARECHFTDYIVKPIDLVMIREVVRNTLNS